VLLNLAGNAVKFVNKGGVLMLAERSEGGRLRFTVSDTGPGIPESQREAIFEAFMQVEPGGESQRAGAGLGLAIALGLARAMEGALGVDGQEGHGADFWFEAPFERGGPGERHVSLEGRTVAVASPSAIVREAAARQIEASGGRAMRATGVEEALPLTDEGAVILIDHELARGGVTLSPPAGRHAVVLLKAEERDQIDDYRAAGFDGYLIKPLRRASLVERVLAAGHARAADDDRIAPPRPSVAAAAAGTRVLLAEDNPINAILAGALLRREGAVVTHVENGEAALAALVRGAFDLVLMDVRMPGLSGLETTRALRARGVTTPVVALTANAFDDDRRACLESGMDDFLVKPLNPDTLRGVLTRLTAPGWTRGAAQAKVAS
jgi:CheY-like chemotaxis protein